MDYTTDYRIEQGICFVKVVGRYRRPEDSIQFVKQAVELGQKHHCFRLLIDVRQAIVEGGALGAFQVVSPRHDWGFDRRFSIAIVYRNNRPDHQFLENAASNRGYSVRIFKKAALAIDWLYAVKPGEAYSRNRTGKVSKTYSPTGF